MSKFTQDRARVAKFAEQNSKYLRPLGVDLLERYDRGGAQVRTAILADVDRGSRRGRINYFSEQPGLARAALSNYWHRHRDLFDQAGVSERTYLNQFSEGDEDRREQMLQDIDADQSDSDQPDDDDDRSLLRRFTDKYPNLLAKRGTSAEEFVENVMSMPDEERQGVMGNVRDSLGDEFSDEVPMERQDPIYPDREGGARETRRSVYDRAQSESSVPTDGSAALPLFRAIAAAR